MVDQDSASIPVNDLTLRRGYGLFDFFRVQDEKCLYLRYHIERLFNGIDGLGLVVDFDGDSLTRQIRDLTKTNKLSGTSGMRVVVTGGPSPDGFTPSAANVIITQERFKEPILSSYEKGVSIVTMEYKREQASFKSINYMNAVFMAPFMRQQGALEILYHYDGNVSECTRSNVFCVSGGVLHTPVSDALKGITRKNVLDIAKNVIAVKEEDFSLGFLKQADEVFITSTIKRILPVTEIDREPVGNGMVGPATRQLMALLQKRDRDEALKLDI